MPSQTSSEIVTEGIRVRVVPRYLPERSNPEAKSFVFTYKVTIANEGNEWAKLKERHWIIIDSDGNREDVYGPGVVGEEPELYPGEAHTYSSFCPLPTDFGTMEGSFAMVRENGEVFQARVARFYFTIQS